MKRLFTFAILGMIASLTFAQAPVAKSKAVFNKIEQRLDYTTMKSLATEAKEAKAMEKAKAEKAAAATEKSFSKFRTSTFAMPWTQSMKGQVLAGVKFDAKRTAAATMSKSRRKTTTQEGNVTVTTDEHGIITDVTGVAPKMYQRATTGAAYYYNNGGVSLATQSGAVEIIEDGSNVYIKNPITRYTTGAWVKGVKVNNTISVATKQPLLYNAQYTTTISLRWGVIPASGEGISVADDIADSFTFTINGDVLTLEGTIAYDGTADAPYMGAFWDDENAFTGYGDAATVLTYDPTYTPPSTTLVTLPEGATVTEWFLNGNSVSPSSTTPVKNSKINVAFVDNDVYVQGLSVNFPTAWVKGTIDGTTVTFGKFQYVGITQNQDCWFVGYNTVTKALKDAVATYDALTKTISFSDEILINAASDRVYYAEWYSDAVLTAEKKEFTEPVITDLTTTLPYLNTLDTDEEQAEAAIYDANDDKSTFSFEKNSTSGSMAARYRYGSVAADDYLVFPGMALEAGKTYKISIDAASYSPSYPERVEVLAGKEAKASKFDIPVIASTDIASKEYLTLSNGEFTVSEDGVYYFAVHAISDADQFYLWIDNFSVKENDAAAPASVADLNVVADAQGANKATVTFTMPAATIGGAALTSELTAEIKRDGNTIATKTGAAGSAVSLDDAVDAAGFYTYSVTTSYDGRVSDAAELKAYIGYDTPHYIENITIADKSGVVALAWEAPTTGANGYVINPADFKYNVYPVEMMEFFGMTFPVTDYENPYKTGLTETAADIEFDTNSGEHGFAYFAVTTTNTTGESEDAYASVVTGAPYTMPFKESVAGASLSYWWGTASDSNNRVLEGGVYIAEEDASDSDGGCFALVGKTAGWVSLESGKIALAGTANPVVTFDHKATSAISFDVIAITPKGETKLETITSGTSYAPAKVSLVQFADEDWVRLVLKANYTAAGNLFIDNVKVYNCLDHNLVATKIFATPSVEAGKDIEINVEVENQGSVNVEAGAYTVELYCNGEKVNTTEGPAIASDAKATVAFIEKTTVMTSGKLSWNAVVVYAADEDNTNNATATVSTTIKTSNYPAVTDLTGQQNGANVELSWSEPDLEAVQPVTVTDDFESYESFSTTAGDWTFVDVDQSPIGGFQGLDIPNIPQQSLQSFWVHDVTDAAIYNQTFASHSGTKYLGSMFRYDGGQVDDWAISPMLSGNAQTISFYARSYSADYPETIEILYSTTGKDIADFTTIETHADISAEWTEYTAELPAGAKYFAIRSKAADAFFLMVDDVTYETTDVPADLSLVGYNVYRDGEKLNAEPVAEAEYTDTNVAEGEHSYVVTVVYTQGESKASNVFTLATTGIENIEAGAAAKSGNVYTVEGVLVRKAGESLDGLKSGLYIVNGKKVIIKK